MLKHFNNHKNNAALVTSETSVENLKSHLEHVKLMWAKRLRGCQRSVDVWQRLLSIRSLVLTPQEDFRNLVRVLQNMSKSWKHGSIIQDTIDTGMERKGPVKLKATDHFGSVVVTQPIVTWISSEIRSGPTSDICCFRAPL